MRTITGDTILTSETSLALEEIHNLIVSSVSGHLFYVDCNKMDVFLSHYVERGVLRTWPARYQRRAYIKV